MSYYTHVKVTKVNEDQFWVPLARSSDPGRLKGIGIANGDRTEHWIKIEINGSEIVKDKFCGGSTGEYENSDLTFDIPFSDSLKVYGRDKTARSKPRFWVTFVTFDDESEL